jgi:hypothetical protein
VLDLAQPPLTLLESDDHLRVSDQCSYTSITCDFINSLEDVHKAKKVVLEPYFF